MGLSVPRIPYDRLAEFGARLFHAGGVPEDDARLLATLLARADLRGYSGHGITRVPSYLAWTKDGTTDLGRKPKIIRRGKATAVIDGNRYIGQVAARDAMLLAIEKAKEHGTGTVCLLHAGHIGRLADYMEMAADKGMIGVGAVSVGAGSVTLYGGMERITGTNPMSFGIPARGGRHIVLDFATSSMSMGEIQKRQARGEAIPADAMLDGRGRPTSDIKTFRGPPRGALLPFGGYKGSGLNVVAEVLGGLLSGNGPGRDWWDRGAHAVNGVFLQALDVEEFQPREKFFDQVDEFVAHAKALKPAPGFGAVLLPGDRARKIEERQLKDGVEIDEATWAGLLKVAGELGIKDIPKPV